MYQLVLDAIDYDDEKAAIGLLSVLARMTFMDLARDLELNIEGRSRSFEDENSWPGIVATHMFAIQYVQHKKKKDKLPKSDLIVIGNAAYAVVFLFKYFSDPVYRNDKEVLDVARNFPVYVEKIDRFMDWFYG